MGSLEIREIRIQVGYTVLQGAKATTVNYSRDLFVKCLFNITCIEYYMSQSTCLSSHQKLY